MKRTVLVTGANRGIGLAIAREYEMPTSDRDIMQKIRKAIVAGRSLPHDGISPRSIK